MGLYDTTIDVDTPLTHWKLGDSGTTAVDRKGHQNGTYGGTHTRQVASLVAPNNNDLDLAAKINGGAVTVVDTAALRLNGSWTIEWWATMVVASGFPGPMNKGNGKLSGQGYLLWVDITNRKLQFTRDNVNQILGVLPTLGVHAHNALAYDLAAQTLSHYINGVSAVAPITSLTFATGVGTGSLTLGQTPDDAGNGNHLLDEVAFYESALSGARVLAHYEAGVYERFSHPSAGQAVFPKPPLRLAA